MDAPHENAAFLPRHALADLRRGLKSSRVVYLVGARHTGKTTLVRSLFREGYCDLDDENQLRMLQSDPLGHLQSLAASIDGPVVIDEVQKLKDLALVIKRIVDEERRFGQFLLAGCTNMFTLPDSADSLAGRVWTTQLWPLTASELKRRPVSRLLDWAAQSEPDLAQIAKPENLLRDEYIDIFLRGGFPEALGMDAAARAQRHERYVDMLVEQDAKEAIAFQKPAVLRALIRWLAARTAAEMNVAAMTSALGVSRQTAEHYLDLLTRMFIVCRLSTWMADDGRHGVRPAKYHFLDTGMACSLRGLDASSFRIGAGAVPLGPLAETFAFRELLCALPLQHRHFRLHHWRSVGRKRIDILACTGDAMVGIKVRASRSFDPKDFAHLDAFEKQGLADNRRFTGVVLYMGDQAYRFGARRFLLPLSALWSPVDIAERQGAP